MLEAISHSNSKESSSKEVEADEAKTVDLTGPKINLSEGVAHEQLEKVSNLHLNLRKRSNASKIGIMTKKASKRLKLNAKARNSSCILLNT